MKKEYEEKIIKEALKKNRTPFYFYNEKKFIDNYIELEEAFKNIYSNFQIAYSFKANYMPAICKKAKELGSYAEVASDMEYSLAKSYGFPPSCIIVNGPGKWYGLEEMIKDGTTIIVDNEYELEKIIEHSNNLSIKARIGFRLNFDIGSKKRSRFGIDANSDTIEQCIEKARNSNIKICGFHFHLGGSRTIENWKIRASKMIYYSKKYLRENECEFIDLGSGMFGHMHKDFAKQFNCKIASFEQYAATVAKQFNNEFKEYNVKPTLIVEPGSTIVANTSKYCTKVLAVKKIGSRIIAIVDGSVQQLGEIGKNKKLPFMILHEKKKINAYNSIDITGYTCLEDDVLIRDYNGTVAPGDIIVFDNTGAYTNVLKPPFIQSGCKIISLINNELVITKRDEEAGDIISSYYGG